MAREKFKYMPRITEIKVAMVRAEITIAEMASDLGVSKSYVQQCINGHRTSPTLPHSIAKYLNRDVKELFFEVDLRNPNKVITSHAA
jgi:DNA-binding XRE family transcriptional regulator